MKTMYEIFKENKSRVSEKIDNKTYDFYAFVGYHPIIRELIISKTHAGIMGCFQWMFVEKDKAKAVSVIRDSNGNIETVCFLIYDSYIIGEMASSEAISLGNMGFYTHPINRGNDNMTKAAKFMIKNLKNIIDDLDDREIYVQDYISKKIQDEIPMIKVKPLECGQNDGTLWHRVPKHPYSVDFKKEIKLDEEVYKKRLFKPIFF